MIILGIADLGINLPVLIAQLVNFTVLLVVLRLVAWGPLTKMLDERQRADRARASPRPSRRRRRRPSPSARCRSRSRRPPRGAAADRAGAGDRHPHPGRARAQAQADAEATLVARPQRDPAGARHRDRRPAQGVRRPDDLGGREGHQPVARPRRPPAADRRGARQSSFREKN